MRKIPILLILVLLSSSLFSQVINVEQERIKTDTLGWNGTAQISFQYLKNKSEVWNIGARLHSQYKTNKSLILFITDYTLSKSAGSDFANAGVQHVRYNYKFKKWLIGEAFTQVQFNKILNVNFRWLGGLGPRFQVLKTNNLRLYAAALYMYEYEELTNHIYNRDHRLSSYISFSYHLTKNLSLSNTTYYQPKFLHFGDYRISSQTDMKIDISKHLSFKLSYLYFYDAVPAEGVPRETQALNNTLGFEF